jgi:hypothetical protein
MEYLHPQLTEGGLLRVLETEGRLLMVLATAVALVRLGRVLRLLR